MLLGGLNAAPLQHPTRPQYQSPVNYPMVLAGNFAEPRPNHFHGGVDIKTGGVEGKPIFSVGDGYVSQVSIGIAGFGNAVYVHHPEGYTSIYCHLKKFTPQIKAMVRKWQYEHHKCTGIMRFRPTDLPVARGQLIAVSGNTGNSTAPHLHLEIHENKTWNMLDPLTFIGHEIDDSVPPVAHAMMAYPQKASGVFCGASTQQSFGFSSHFLERDFTAWGKVGFGLWANDYMQQTYNHYGIRTTRLLVDGRLVFESVTDNISVDDNMQVNAWGDYQHYLRSNVWYMQSFLKPGLTLGVFPFHENRGIINFNEERNYHLCYELSDFKGNTSRYEWIVRGHRQQLPKVTPVSAKPFLSVACNRFSNIQMPGLQLYVRPWMTADDISLQPRIIRKPDAWSDSYRLMPYSCPLYNYAKIALRVNKRTQHTEKLYITSDWENQPYLGGKYQNGWVTGKLRDLGMTCRVAYDDTPPIITPIGEGQWTSSNMICLKISDAASGVSSYEATLDGNFILLEKVDKSPCVQCILTETPVNPLHKKRQLKVTATDHCGNRNVYHTTIYY